MVRFTCISAILSFKYVLVLAVYNQLFSFIILLGLCSVHQKTCLGWIICKRSEKLKSFNGTLVINKSQLMLKNTMFFKNTFGLIVQEYHGSVILFGAYFHVDTASLIINNNKISLHSHFFSETSVLHIITQRRQR